MKLKQQNIFISCLLLILGSFISYKTLAIQRIYIGQFGPFSQSGCFKNIADPLTVNAVAVFIILWTLVTCYLLLRFEEIKKTTITTAFLIFFCCFSLLGFYDSFKEGSDVWACLSYAVSFILTLVAIIYLSLHGRKQDRIRKCRDFSPEVKK